MDDDDEHPSIGFMFDAAAAVEMRQVREIKYACLVEDSAQSSLQTGHSVWNGALILADAIECAPESVLELGAGCGLSGLVLASRGSRVTFTDRDPGTLKLVDASIEANDFSSRCSTLRLSFGERWCNDKVDCVIASDVIYDSGLASLICCTAASALTPLGVFYLCSSFDVDADELEQAFKTHGFDAKTLKKGVWMAQLLVESFSLRPKALFPTYNGTVALAFTGWPRSALELKDKFASSVVENPGSKWPKVTLGAITRPLSLEEFTVLSSLLKAVKFADDEDFRWTIDTVHVSHYQCGSHEKLGSPLKTIRLSSTNIRKDDSPSHAEEQRVQELMSEADDLQTYLPRFNGDRLDHSLRYTREDRPGRSLVAFLDGHLAPTLNALRADVDGALGVGTFRWFNESALHCTLRAL